MKLPQVRSDHFVPQGGLDIVSPPLLLANGVAFDAQNWEVDIETGGYSRIGGYDKYVNGKTASEMDIKVAILSCATGFILSGERLTGATSGATMVLGVEVQGSTPHTLGSGATNIACYVYDVQGQFIEGEAIIREPGFYPATVYLESIPEGFAGTAEEVEEQRAEAESAIRRYMDKPGSGVYISSQLNNDLTKGPTLGVFVLNDIPYVVRSKNPALTESGNTNAVFIRPATAAGFSNRYWEVASDQASIPTDGAHFEFVASNFANPSGSKVIFGVSGTSKAFHYDGSTFGFITTGMTDDRPSHIAVHDNRLWLSFKGSVQFSSFADSSEEASFPHLTWDPLEGLAGEISAGSEITGLLSVTGSENSSALLISTKEKIVIVYGSGDGYQVVPFSDNTGALPYTMQWIGTPVFQNIFGLTALSASDAFGGFQESSISGPVKTFMDRRRGKATASLICRDKNQYRLFFNDGTALYVTFRDGSPIGMFTEKLKHKVTCAWSCVLSDDTELMLIGTEDGGLYKLDVGTSFAGETIPHHIRFAFNQFKSPRIEKRFKRTVVEASSEGYAKFAVGYDLDYGGPERGVTVDADIESPDFDSGGFWDAGTWDVGYWDGATATPFTIDTPGIGGNLSIRFRGNDRISRPINVTGVMIDYIIGRQKRS